MPNFLSDAMNWLDSTLAQTGVAGEEITYQRAGDSVSITAIIGATDLQREADGMQISFRSTDFLITAADLVLSGVTTKPRRGDRITRESASSTNVYEVLAIDGEQCYSISEPSGRTLRVHAKLIREE